MESVLGRMCCSISHQSLAPTARAAIMKSRSLRESTCPRTSRHVVTQPSAPRIRISTSAEGDQTVAAISSRKIVGTDSSVLINHMITSSITPP